MTCEAFHDLLHMTTRSHDYNAHDTTTTKPSSFVPGQNVWVCKSKGRKPTKTKQTETNMRHNRSERDDPQHPPAQHRYELFSRATIVTVDDERQNKDEHQLDRRILVQYPLGSTYHVRSELLLPIFDINFVHQINTRMNHPRTHHDPSHVVVVYPETHEYRRACHIHTGPTTDHFIEIGCAQGFTCARIHHSHCRNHPHTNHDNTPQQENSRTSDDHNPHRTRRRLVLGIDKSTSCIESAHATYGHLSTTTDPLPFVTYDLFQPSIVDHHGSSNDTVDDDVHNVLQCLRDGYHRSINADIDHPTTTATMLSDDHVVDTDQRHQTDMDNDNSNATFAPDATLDGTTTSRMGLVVAIDINGNRDIAPIVQCLHIIMHTRFTSLLPERNETHHHARSAHPRLIIVKSRSLYLYLQQQQ